MDIMTQGINILSKIVILLGGGFAIFGIVTYLEGYANNNPSSKANGIGQFFGGFGIILVGFQLVPKLVTLLGM